MVFEAKILGIEDTRMVEEFYIHSPDPAQLNMNLKLDRSPDFWESLSVLGYKTLVLGVIEKSKNHLACACIISLRECFIDGKVHETGYISGMKVRAEYRGSAAFAYFARLFNACWAENKAVCWFFSAFSDNVTLNKLMGKKHSLFPEVKCITRYNTYLLKPTTARWASESTKQLDIRLATNQDKSIIETFLLEQSTEKDFLQSGLMKDLEKGTGQFLDLALSQVALALENNKIVGMAALWDQRRYRRWHIESYSRKFSLLRPAINVAAKIKSLPHLPKSGEVINYLLLSLCLIKNNDPEIFRPLLYLLTSSLKKKHILSVGLIEGDPLNKLFERNSMKLQNNLYIAYKEENSGLIDKIRINKIYMEQGGL